jgi:DNA polymerase III subunit delta
VSDEVAGLHLVLGDEELLVERAVAAVLRQARKQAGTHDVPVDRLRAGEVSTSELAELLSPSLFADERVVVLEAAGEAGKDAATLIADAAADLPPGTMLVVVHSGGGRAKALADQLKKLGAQVHPCARITKASERADFVRKEFRALKAKVSDDTVTAVLDAVGSDIRELAAVCSQLVADTDGAVDAAAVRRYHSGKAEVKGFDIADKAVVGDVAGAAEALRWAMMRGEPQVVLADALAEAVHTIARVAPLSGDPYRLAAELGMPPWRVQKAQKQARRWSRGSIAEAMQLVATLNADVKGAAADADYALEAAVRKVAELAADSRQVRIGAGTGRRLNQILLNDRASADLRLAAWFLWMTPLLAALSSLRLVATSNSPALSLSPASMASRNPRTAV